MSAISSLTMATGSPSADSMPRSGIVPTGIIQGNLLSSTSSAAACFINQQFSAKLQAYMIGYVGSIYSYFAVDLE